MVAVDDNLIRRRKRSALRAAGLESEDGRRKCQTIRSLSEKQVVSGVQCRSLGRLAENAGPPGYRSTRSDMIVIATVRGGDVF